MKSMSVKESFEVGETMTLVSLQWTETDSLMSYPMGSMSLQAMNAIAANAMCSAARTDDGAPELFDGVCVIVLKFKILYCFSRFSR